MIRLDDLVEANRLLMQFGGEDQMPRLAAASIERALELQNRVDRALEYAREAPPNSAHARNMARILDGSITVEDVHAEVGERVESRPLAGPARQALPSRNFETFERPVPKRVKGGKIKTNKGGVGLSGRSTKERGLIREWIEDQGIEIAPFGRIPEKYIEAYDESVKADREARRQKAARQSAGDLLDGQASIYDEDSHDIAREA